MPALARIRSRWGEETDHAGRKIRKEMQGSVSVSYVTQTSYRDIKKIFVRRGFL
ncbi:protein of unknown function [Paraburkholderia kururiensis]